MPAPRRLSGAVAVAAGILLSRLAGLARERAIAHYLGISAAADAFRAALRVPNVLQNLLGEGVLSASFIPVYARLLAEGRTADASRMARAIASLLVFASSLMAAVGVLLADPLVELLAPGFETETRALTARLVRILFPGVALLVLSAWCLGVLNSHRRFFLSYASPVLWNTALIAALLAAGRRVAGQDFAIATWLAWGAVIGSLAQLLVQLPSVLRLLGAPTASSNSGLKDPNVRATLRAFGPVVIGRGSVQISGYVDQILASFLGQGIVAALANAQTLYLLPVSLFGMAVSAAELPEMSGVLGRVEAEEARAQQLRERLTSSLRRVVFFVVPSAALFITLGDSVVQLLFQSGRFGREATNTVWLLLAGSALGLTAATQGRLLASAFYALGDTRSPLRASLLRVGFTAVTGWLITLPLRQALGYDARWGALGLTASASLAAWLEFESLRRMLTHRIGSVPIPVKLTLGSVAIALVAGAGSRGVAYGIQALTGPEWLVAVGAIGAFGGLYGVGMLAAGVPEASALLGRLKRGLRR
jgi:putative peptidoglycan lipid II flippase